MAAHQTDDEYLTPCEAARVVRRSARTLARYRAEGVGPGYHKFGRQILYPRLLLHEWVSETLTQPVRSQA